LKHVGILNLEGVAPEGIFAARNGEGCGATLDGFVHPLL
jgi:hypothetical protein